MVLLPRARLPLHIFEPRYLAMIDDALATQGRMIGMVQPNGEIKTGNDKPAVYAIGCAGRITSFAEMDDGRMMISLTGLSRFEIQEELNMDNPYRQVHPNWEKFVSDLTPPTDTPIDHERLSRILQPYFKTQSIEADWTAIESMEDEMLVSTLAMICPLPQNEKQALLEAPDLATRANMLMTLLEMASLPPSEGHARH